MVDSIEIFKHYEICIGTDQLILTNNMLQILFEDFLTQKLGVKSEKEDISEKKREKILKAEEKERH